MSFQEKMDRVRERVDRAAQRAGRRPEEIAILPVTKGVTPALILEAKNAGFSTFGENRVQEALAKIPALPPDIQWHMIGHLQTNKVREAVSSFALIQSMDSVRLAEKANQEAQAAGLKVPVLLEVNISGEAKKYGFKPEELYGAVEKIFSLSNLCVRGLMGISPLVGDAQAKRQAFGKLKNLFSVCKTLKSENLEMRILSMGMSDDFEIAVEEGSNLLRLGRVLFR